MPRTINDLFPIYVKQNTKRYALVGAFYVSAQDTEHTEIKFSGTFNGRPCVDSIAITMVMIEDAIFDLEDYLTQRLIERLTSSEPAQTASR